MPMRCGGRPRGSARRSCRSASSRIPAARAAPTAASCRSSARSRVHPIGSRLRRAGRGGRKRSVRQLPAVSDLGGAAGRGLRGPHSEKLGPGARPMGRKPVAEPLRGDVLAPHDRARRAGVGGGAHDRRGRLARTQPADPKAMLDFFKSPDFALAAFKGQRLTLRDWNLQLRQPILLADGRVIVSVSPQEGFLHQVSELDTLGYDRPETKCRLQMTRWSEHNVASACCSAWPSSMLRRRAGQRVSSPMCRTRRATRSRSSTPASGRWCAPSRSASVRAASSSRRIRNTCSSRSATTTRSR